MKNVAFCCILLQKSVAFWCRELSFLIGCVRLARGLCVLLPLVLVRSAVYRKVRLVCTDFFPWLGRGEWLRRALIVQPFPRTPSPHSKPQSQRKKGESRCGCGEQACVCCLGCWWFASLYFINKAYLLINPRVSAIFFLASFGVIAKKPDAQKTVYFVVGLGYIPSSFHDLGGSGEKKWFL